MRMRRPSEDDEMHDHMVSGWGDMSRVACVLVIDGPGGGPWVCYKLQERKWSEQARGWQCLQVKDQRALRWGRDSAHAFTRRAGKKRTRRMGIACMMHEHEYNGIAS
jgi:hypothetical protein